MGTFSKEELLILDKIIEQIETQVSLGIEENVDTDRMLYATCVNDEEKDKLTRKVIKKHQKQITKCPAIIAPYITAYINPNSSNIKGLNKDQYRKRLISNYVATHFVNVCENLLEHKFETYTEIEEEADEFWEVLLESQFYGVEDDIVEDFIKYMIIADKIKIYKIILNEVEGLNPTHKMPAVINDTKSKSNDRMKTSLSVPQIALLFKMINDLKPSIFKVNSEAELHRFISANFQTKSSDPEKGISENKLRILFNQPDSKAIEFWEKHLRTMLAEIKKLK